MVLVGGGCDVDVSTAVVVDNGDCGIDIGGSSTMSSQMATLNGWVAEGDVQRTSNNFPSKLNTRQFSPVSPLGSPSPQSVLIKRLKPSNINYLLHRKKRPKLHLHLIIFGV